MKKPVILCVDDDEFVLDLLKRILQSEFGDQFTIKLAESGEAAIEIVDQVIAENLDLSAVISDFIMPGMNGNELFTIIKERSPGTPTIIISGQASHSNFADTANCTGVYRFIAKPWHESDLILTVTEALRRYENEKQLEHQTDILVDLYQQAQDELILRKQAERNLRDHQAQLEELVLRRTAELEKLNVQLQRDINRRREAELALQEVNDDLAHRIEELSTLNYIAGTAAAATDLETGLTEITHAITALFEAHSSSISLFDMDARTQTLVATDNRMIANVVGKPIPISDKTTSARIIHIKQAQIISFNDSDWALLQMFDYGQLATMTCCMAIPLVARAQVVGLILIYLAHPQRRFAAIDLSLAETVAGQIIGPIENIRFFEKEQKQRQLAEQTLAELQSAQQDLVQSEKMATLGQLVASVAHEINSPLGAIQAAIENISNALHSSMREAPCLLQTLDEENRNRFFNLIDRGAEATNVLPTKEERKHKRALCQKLQALGVEHAIIHAELLACIGIYDDVETFLPLLRHENSPAIIKMAYKLARQQGNSENIHIAVVRAAKIVTALKNYARQDHVEKKSLISLKESIETAITIYHNKIKSDVELIRLYEDLPAILCYADEMDQVWANLINNALQAMQYKGRLIISLKQIDGNQVAMVTDNGPGIPRNIVDHIFQPFFTTKARGEGNGLGLDIVQRIVKKHEGSITVDSRPGETTFTVSIPDQQ